MKILYTLLVFSILISCSSDDNNSNSDNFLGTWRYNKVSITEPNGDTFVDTNNYCIPNSTLEFLSNGNMEDKYKYPDDNGNCVNASEYQNPIIDYFFEWHQSESNEIMITTYFNNTFQIIYFSNDLIIIESYYESQNHNNNILRYELIR